MEYFKFSYQIRVRYAEIDGEKIVFNSRYMEYMDIAMDEYCRRIFGQTWTNVLKSPLEIALVRVEIDFMKPARLDDLLKVYCKIIRLGNSSMEAKFCIVRESDGAELVKSRVVYVVFDVEEAHTAPIPPDIRQAILEFEGLGT